MEDEVGLFRNDARNFFYDFLARVSETHEAVEGQFRFRGRPVANLIFGDFEKRVLEVGVVWFPGARAVRNHESLFLGILSFTTIQMARY